MLPFSYAEKVKELAHLGGVDDYKLLTCKIGDLWRFVVVDQCYKNMSAVGKHYTSEKALLLDAYDYAVMSWQATPTDPQWLRYKKKQPQQKRSELWNMRSVYWANHHQNSMRWRHFICKIYSKN